MFAWVALALTLIAGPAYAAPGAPSPEATITRDDPTGGAVEDPFAKAKAKKEAEEAEREARLAALEAAQSGVAAKVVVLAWPGAPDVDYDHAGLQGNIKARIARPDAKFFPEIDLYQVGRRHPDRSIPPNMQPGKVPDEAKEIVMAAVRDIETVPWNGMAESDWGITANTLRGLTEEIWFVDRPDLREPLFRLYVEIGRAAENMNNPVAPFYQQVGGQLLNYYWYLAGSLAYNDPALLDSLTVPEMRSSIEYYRDLLANKEIRFMTLSFEQGGVWDAKKFATEYKVYINGIETLITDPQSLYQVPPGRVDIFLKRTDGYSISDRVDLSNLDDKIYFVRDVARKKMGIDFVDQLMEHPNECTPRVEGDIMISLAIYASLHEDAEVFYAVPVAGDPNKTLLWRWNTEAKTLTKVLDETGGYPIRFAVLAGAGTTFGSGGLGDPVCEPNPIPGQPDICQPGEPEFGIFAVPIYAQLRAHYRRLLVAFGAEAGIAPNDPGFQDTYALNDGHVVTDANGDPAIKTSQLNAMFYAAVGFVIQKKASLGLGPRAYVRFGGYTLPHIFDITGHVGLTLEPPGMEQKGRVRLILDADAFAGVTVPYAGDSTQTVKPSFGIAIGAGTTF